MAYTTIKKPSDYFNTKLYTGDGNTTQAITGVGFQPDFSWVKNRDNSGWHRLTNSVVGATKHLFSNSNSSESTTTDTNGYFESFDSDGVTVNRGSVSGNGTNLSSNKYVLWNWLASNTTASNTDGSITSTVSANTTSGFSIVKYTGTSANATVGHNLNAVPKMIIIKNLDQTDDWYVYHVSRGATQHIILNSTGIGGSNATLWQNTEPTSSVFSIGTNNVVNTSGENYIAYCFAEKQGFSKFGSYVGNGNADGTFIYTGFRPAFFLFKRTDIAGNSWGIMDNKRSTSGANVIDKGLKPDDSGAEYTVFNKIDFTSNGIKLRSTDSDNNASGSTYIYMAFAEEPLVGDNPCTAR